MRAGAVGAVLLILGTVACAEPETVVDDGTWVGTITTERNVTTVVNESGSVWGGTATLVEEASIGVDAGEDAYMLGPVRAVAATDDEVYVLDMQVPALRVYDMSGRHLRDIGAEGNGPAEFRTPSSLVIGTDGRIYLRDYGNDRIMVFSPQGEEVGTLPLQGSYRTANEMVATLDGTVYNYERIVSDDPEVRLSGMVRRSLEEDRSGEPVLPPDFGFEAWRLTAGAESLSITSPVPFSPTTIWTIAPSGAVIAGVSDEYSFEIRYPDGRITRVVKRGDRVPVDPAEGDWYRKQATARMRRNVPEWRWNSEDVPAVKPTFQQFIPDHSGRVWVIRPGPGRHVEGECNEDPQPDNASRDPCWRSTVTWEVFDEDGRFLGDADIPGSVNSSPRPYIRGDMFLAPASDAAGTIMVKRYRLVLPGER